MLKEKDLSLTGDDEGGSYGGRIGKSPGARFEGQQKRNFPTARWMESFSELSEKNGIILRLIRNGKAIIQKVIHAARARKLPEGQGNGS